MKLDILVRSFMIAGLISLLVVVLEACFYGLINGAYSVTSPFFGTGISSSTNMALIGIVFVSSFLIVLSKISKNERV